MPVDENKAVVRRFNEITQEFFRGGDVNGLDDVCAPDIVLHGPGMPPDLAGFKQMAPAFRAAFPDMEVVAHGAGIWLAGDASSEQIRETVQRIVTEPSHREAAQRLGNVLATENGAETAAKEIEAVV